MTGEPPTWDEIQEQDRQAAFVSRQPRPRPPSRAERVFNSAVLAAERCQRQGLPITVETLCMQANPTVVTAKLASELLINDKFLNALDARGIRLPEHEGLSSMQLHALSIYMDMSVSLTHAAKLRAMGITDSVWRGWNQQAAFSARLSEIAEERLQASTPVALQRIAEGVDSGDRKFIELQLEMTNRHDRRKETVDLNKILMLIFNVIDEEIKDPATLERVGERMKKLHDQGLLGGPVVPVPRNAVARPTEVASITTIESRQTTPD